MLKTVSFTVDLPKKPLVGLVVSPTLGEAQFPHIASTLDINEFNNYRFLFHDHVAIACKVVHAEYKATHKRIQIP